MIRSPLSPGWKLFLGVLSLFIVAGLYTWLSEIQHRKNPRDTTIPSWSQMKVGLVESLEVNRRSGDRWLVSDSAATLGRLMAGLAVGISISIVLGLAMGCVPWIEHLLSPPLALLAQVPPTAALAVFFVLAGTGTKMFITMIAVGIIPALAQSIYLAVKEVPDELVYKAYTLGASHWEVVLNIIFPTVLPRIIDSIRLQIGPAMVYLIAAEMMVGDIGFGYRIRLQSKRLSMEMVYPYLAILALFGFLADNLCRRARKFFCPWYGEEGDR